MVTVDNEPVETYSLYTDLNSQQIKVLSNLLEKFKHGMTPSQDRTTTIDNDIELQTSEPVIAKFYPVHVKLKEHFDKEVDILLKLKIFSRHVLGVLHLWSWCKRLMEVIS